MNHAYQASITSMLIHKLKPQESRWTTPRRFSGSYSVLPERRGLSKAIVWIVISILGAVFIGNLYWGGETDSGWGRKFKREMSSSSKTVSVRAGGKTQ